MFKLTEREQLIWIATNDKAYETFKIQFGYLIMRVFGCGTLAGICVGLAIGAIMGMVTTLKMFGV